MTKDNARSEIERLVKQFSENEAYYLAADKYDESNCKAEFIDLFFEALGWDITNRKGLRPDRREVFRENSIEKGDTLKRVDYAFFFNGGLKFLVEAKAPHVNLDNEKPVYQIKEYAWNKKSPIGILTDFEQFRVFDCRYKPSFKKKNIGLLEKVSCNYKDYLKYFDDIYDFLSYEAVAGGSIARYLEKDKSKNKGQEVDEVFLKDLASWRELLAKHIATNNKEFIEHSADKLNEAVQRIIDRLVFIRVVEDRGVVEETILDKYVDVRDIYSYLIDVFRKFDLQYNGGLFKKHFSEELIIEDRVLRDVIEHLYPKYEKGSYRFDVLPVEILGHIYERFLGSEVRITASGNAKVEEKPEVRKAGGVYYTPQYIVEYIVENTLGKLIEGKTPKQIEKIRVLDPACGSGSFLLGAYNYLIRHHVQYYSVNKEGEKTDWYKDENGNIRLTLQRKGKLLVNNIFGVDIDPQAVEVTQMSLYVKLMEKETKDSVKTQQALWKSHLLPDLSKNIKNGNSIISVDYDGENADKVKPFDWENEFSDKFDVVIGNPPYIRTKNVPSHIKKYMWLKYTTFTKKSDIYCVFIERGISLLKDKGVLGFITSNAWLRLDSFEELRKHILDNVWAKRILEFTYYVFDNASVKTAIQILSKNNIAHAKTQVLRPDKQSQLSEGQFKSIKQELFRKQYKALIDLSLDEESETIKDKLRSYKTTIGQVFEISFGLKTGDDDKFISKECKNSKYKPLLRGENIHRFLVEFNGEYVWYAPDKMRENKKTARPGTQERFEQPKVLVRDTGDGLQATFDEHNYYVKDVLVLSLPNKNKNDLLYLTGLLNSSLLRYYYETSFPTLHVQCGELASLPYRVIDDKNKDEKENYNKIIKLVVKAIDESGKSKALSGIDKITNEIDVCVYRLYGLSEKEIKIIEGAM